ncbi:hypothetical protein EG850_07745 [Gulosibacter macacae]|uniref:Uncharacterized protein n=1 Tax=Gulosibacter macacae TaxID=2488791 RepID=A0A3P3VUP8_9MICO|nr:hypothetical protein [Gulosibacter macacae]RRJ86535.1 hypothetical protein EG850_07745 [Gulosibacter macacae]
MWGYPPDGLEQTPTAIWGWSGADAAGTLGRLPVRTLRAGNDATTLLLQTVCSRSRPKEVG